MIRPTSSRTRRFWLALLLYSGFTVIATYPLAFRAKDHVRGHGDPTLNIWAISWVNHQLPRDPAALFDGNVFHPHSRTLAFSEHLFLPALLATPFLALTDNPVFAYNTVILLSLTLAALGMFLFCYELTSEPVGAFAGGLLYAFHTWNINELLRIQIISNQWFPLFLLTLVRFAGRPSWRMAWAAALCYALQSLSCMYWALYLPLVALPTVLFLKWRQRLSWRALFPLLAALGCILLLTSVFAIPYLANSSLFNYERTEPAAISVDRYFDVLQGNHLYQAALGTARVNENAAHFLGFFPLGLALFAFWPRPSAARDAFQKLRPLLLSLAFAGFLLSLGPDIRFGSISLGWGPYAALFDWVPGFQSVRYPERFALILMLGLAPLVAGGLARIRARLGKAVVGALSLLVFLEHFSAPLELQTVPVGQRIPEVYRWIGKQPEIEVVAEVPTQRYWSWRMDADAMYYSTVHRKRTVQGFTGFLPPTNNFIRWKLFHFPEDGSVAFLEKLDVDAVVVGAQVAPSTWSHYEERWSLVGPFPEGHRLLRLSNRSGERFGPPVPTSRKLIELDPTDWKVHASSAGAGRARDRNPFTTWSTIDMQREHHFYAIRFPEPTIPARISMEPGPEYQFPAHFEVLGLIGGDRWVSLRFDRKAVLHNFFAQLLHEPQSASLDIDLTSPAVREVRIRITKTDAFEMPWTMSEIRVYRESHR